MDGSACLRHRIKDGGIFCHDCGENGRIYDDEKDSREEGSDYELDGFVVDDDVSGEDNILTDDNYPAKNRVIEIDSSSSNDDLSFSSESA